MYWPLGVVGGAKADADAKQKVFIIRSCVSMACRLAQKLNIAIRNL